MNVKATVCQTCGGIGFSDLLVYCIQCQVLAVHRYCFDKLPKPSDEEVIWECDQCIPKVDKKVPLDTIASRKSECISLKDSPADEDKIILRQKRKKKFGSSVPETEVGKSESGLPLKLSQDKHIRASTLETVHFGDDFSIPVDDNGVCLHDENCEGNRKFKKWRRLILEDEASSEEEASISNFGDDFSIPVDNGVCLPDENCEGNQKFKKGRQLILEDETSSEEEASRSNIKASEVSLDTCNHPSKTRCHKPSTDFNQYDWAQPIIDPVWRGCVRIYDKRYGLVGLSAHLSSKACLKVCDGANALPPLLGMEILPRFDVWPKSFYRSPPSDDNIALYFFPETERDERFYNVLLQEVIEDDLALKVVTDDTELLVFSSNQLPQDYWRFHGKCYLWGVFRARQVPTFCRSSENIFVHNSKSEKAGIETVSQDEKNVSETRTRSSLSTLSTSSSYGSDLPHSPLHGHREGNVENQRRDGENDYIRGCNVGFLPLEARMSYPFHTGIGVILCTPLNPHTRLKRVQMGDGL